MNSREYVQYTCEAHVATVLMTRPKKKNALNIEILHQLRQAWMRDEEDDDAWIAVITGEGDIFSAGADKSFFAEWVNEGKEFLTEFYDRLLDDPYTGSRLTKPTIAAINGPALGGGVHLFLCSDFRIAEENSFFRLPEPDLGGVLILWDAMPRPIATELMCGLPITYARAYELGIINRIVPKGETLNEAYALAKQLLEKPPLAVRKNIQILNELKNLDDPLPKEELLRYSAKTGVALASGHDWQEAISALLEKKKPTYTGT